MPPKSGAEEPEEELPCSIKGGSLVALNVGCDCLIKISLAFISIASFMLSSYCCDFDGSKSALDDYLKSSAGRKGDCGEGDLLWNLSAELKIIAERPL